ncbi:hypothetical protein HYH03_011989 [Edaphochlamys debaryana]|uniref:Phosphoglycerate mutase n=1 Tax=Edaphochlamys debaryana TaxID=47281 RepID=A0A836BVY0_9CHLO|nr:hypothetical protein HYH03_011989 [Edaphochlamys debaryana]|eukprot:KAG2489538.1 hypothetical protein HYH03_011989 [Edaphochlamys debaryana]
MNEYLSKHRWDAPDFKDPGMYDTVLTERGKRGARDAVYQAWGLNPAPEVLVVSPLTRALQTAELAFLPHYKGPVVVEPLARERVWHASDVGSPRAELERKFPDGRYDFSALPDVWWHCADPSDPRVVGLEPEDAFKERVAEFRRWLAARPESSIAIVAHWGLLYELTGGGDFANCELRTYELVGASGRGQQEEEPVMKERVFNPLSALFR